MITSQGISRRRHLAGSAALLSAALLVGCGAGRAGDSGPEPAVGKAVKPGRFTFLNWWSANVSLSPFMEEAARQWKARRPELELEMVQGAGVDGVRDKFVTGQAAGDPVDSAFSSIVYGRDLYDQQQLRELDPFIRLAPDVADDKFLKSSEQFRKTRGKTFGIPVMGPESHALAINSNIFQAEGLDPQGKDLKTWDDLARIAAQLTRREGQTITRSGFLMEQMVMVRLVRWVNTTGSRLFDVENTKAAFTSSHAQAALEYLARLHNGLRVSVPVTQQGGRGGLTGSPPAAIVESTNTVIWSKPLQEEEQKGFRWWLLPYPTGPGGKGPNTVTWINMVVLARTSRNTEQALEFVRFFCGDVNLNARRLEMAALVSPLRGFFASPA